MEEEPDQHHAPESRPPVLDYGRPDPGQVRLFGKPPSELLGISLGVELVLLVFASLLLDGGMTLLFWSGAWLIYWAMIAIELRRRGYKSRRRDWIIWGVGLAAAVAGLLI